MSLFLTATLVPGIIIPDNVRQGTPILWPFLSTLLCFMLSRVAYIPNRVGLLHLRVYCLVDGDGYLRASESGKGKIKRYLSIIP